MTDHPESTVTCAIFGGNPFTLERVGLLNDERSQE